MSDELKKQLREAKRQIADLQRENAALTIRSTILPLAWASGMQAAAIDDCLLRAEAAFTVEPGRELRSSDGHTPDSWLQAARTFASHWWNEPAPTERKPETKPNPFAKGLNFNLTAQGKLARENPQEAERLAIAAGSPWRAPKDEQPKPAFIASGRAV